MDRNVVGIRALVGIAAITIAGGAAGSGQLMHGGPASAEVSAGVSGAAVPALAADVSSRYASSRATVPVETVVAPAGWAGVTSPFLGYRATLPESWGLIGHVAAADSRTPHDIFAGSVDGSETPTTLVIGTCRTDEATATGQGAVVVTADGGTFAVSAPQPAGPGRMTIVATSVQGDTTWYLTACMADDAASQATFRAIVASFRFPNAGFVPPAGSSPAP